MSGENLESALNTINKFINIDNNRQPYANHFDSLRNQLFAQLQVDPVFKKLLCGHCLQGSYGDNLKVSLPNEFDSVFQLKLPFNEEAIITKDVYFPGNVHIDLTIIFDKIKNQMQYADIWQKLKELVTPSNLLMVEKVQNWLQSIFTNALLKMGNCIIVNNLSSRLIYKKTGPAHCIQVTGQYEYSVDFVPGFVLTQSQNVIRNVNGAWHAIPKPSKPQNHNSISFRASYFDQEAKLMKDNQNLKNVLRIVKKFRDNYQNMSNLKSYYIKTIFLWKHKKSPNYFRSTPLPVIIVEMFHDLENTLMNGMLPFYWDSQCNLYSPYNRQQLDEMFKCVNNIKSDLHTARTQGKLSDLNLTKIFKIFLTKTEQEQLTLSRFQSINLAFQLLQIMGSQVKSSQQSQQQQCDPKQKQQDLAIKQKDEAAKKLAQEQQQRQQELAKKQKDEAAKKLAQQQQQRQQELAKKQKDEAAKKIAQQQQELANKQKGDAPKKLAQQQQQKQQDLAKKQKDEAAMKLAQQQQQKQPDLAKKQNDEAAKKLAQQQQQKQQELAKKQKDEAAKKLAQQQQQKQELAKKQKDEAAKKLPQQQQQKQPDLAKKQKDEAAKKLAQQQQQKQQELAKKQKDEAARKLLQQQSQNNQSQQQKPDDQNCLLS